jgi:hypothetical protein
MFKFHSLFYFLNVWITLLFGLAFAAGDAGLGGAGGSVIDTLVPEVDDTGGDDEDIDEGGGGGELDTTEDGGAGAGGRAEDEGTHNAQDKPAIHTDVNQLLNELKDKNPKLFKRMNGIVQSEMKLRKDLFKLRQDFPNGVADVMALKGAIDEKLGGMDGLEKLGEEISFYHDLDAKWEAKDPSLVKNLAAEYPDEFAVMVPHFVNELAEQNPDAYNKFYAGMVISEVQAEKVPYALYLITEELGMLKELVDNPNAQKYLDRVLAKVNNMSGWVQNLGKLAAAKVPTKQAGAGGNGAANAKETAIAARETQQFNREVSFDYNNFRDGLIKTQLDGLLKDRKKELTPERRQVVTDLILRNLSKKMHAQLPGETANKFRQTVERYEKARDKNGLARFLKSRVKAVLEGENGKAGIVSQAYRIVTGEATLGTKKKDEGGAGGGGGNGTPGTGWIKIGKMPAANQISRSLTEAAGRKLGLDYEGMIMKNRYVLTDGRKVFHD